MSYVRDALMQNWKGTDEHKLLMVSTPRIIKFESEVVGFAIKFLELYARQVLCKRSTLEKDEQKLPDTLQKSYDLYTVKLLNIT